MCKEMWVIPVNRVVDLKRIIRKKWRAKEEESHEGSLTKKGIPDFFSQFVKVCGKQIKADDFTSY
jgi:hypothetical protein